MLRERKVLWSVGGGEAEVLGALHGVWLSAQLDKGLSSGSGPSQQLLVVLMNEARRLRRL